MRGEYLGLRDAVNPLVNAEVECGTVIGEHEILMVMHTIQNRDDGEGGTIIWLNYWSTALYWSQRWYVRLVKFFWPIDDLDDVL